MRLWLIALAVAAIAAGASAQFAGPSNEEIIRNHYRLLNAGEYKRAALDFAEATAHQGAGRTRTATLRVLQDIYETFPDWRMEIVDLVASGNSVVVRSKVSGTHRGAGKFNVNGGLLTGVPPTGKRFEVEHIHWYKMRGGKIAEHFATRNDVGMARQLGVLPPAPAPGSSARATASPAEAELGRVDLEQAAVALSGDAAAMAALLHPSYVVHLTNGRLWDRAQTLTFLRSGSLAKERFRRTQESVVVTGDTGVVMGLDRLESPPPLATRGERNRRYTNVYVRHGGRWKLLARHFHLVP